MIRRRLRAIRRGLIQRALIMVSALKQIAELMARYGFEP